MHFRYRLQVVIGKDKVAAAVILSLAGINHNGLKTNGMSWGGVYADTVKNLCLPVIKLKASEVSVPEPDTHRIYSKEEWDLRQTGILFSGHEDQHLQSGPDNRHGPSGDG